MIASVSTLGIPIGAATPFSFSNFSITVLLSHLLGRHRSSQADQNQRRFGRHARKLAVHDLDRVGIEAFVGHVDQVAIIEQNRPEKGIGRVFRSEQVHRSEGILPFFDGRPLHDRMAALQTYVSAPVDDPERMPRTFCRRVNERARGLGGEFDFVLRPPQ
jgi:hypothetical protein